MVDCRIEFFHGKNRRLFAYSCAWCGKEFWKTQYAKRRFCSKKCIAEDGRSLLPKFDPEKEKYCSKCTTVKTRCDFRENAARRDGLQAWCMICESSYKAQHYRDNSERERKRLYRNRDIKRQEQRAFIVSYLAEHHCVDCGESDIMVLDFDHIKGVKKCNISKLLRSTCSMKRILEEIEKCVVRCANCHRRKTSKERNDWRSLIGLVAPIA